MHAGRRILSWLWMPVSLLLGVRRSMTGASASLLLVAIVSLNIVWGYPWLGMFAATSTLLIVGVVANQLFGPRLVVHLSPPAYAILGESFSVTMHLNHRGRLPTFDNRIGFAPKPFQLGVGREQPIVPCNQQSSQFIPCIEANSRLQTHLSLRGEKRGVHSLPPIESRTLFPFHLFECRRKWKSTSSIAIAPKPLDADNDPTFGRLMDQMNRWTQRWQSGDSFDFAGNREYEVGMPVRRWDFRSWARLGRPIVQEFQSPSMRTVTLVVDASVDSSANSNKSDKEKQEDFEQLLRWVASAIDYWSRLTIATRMYVSSDSVASFLDTEYQGVSELPKLMVQLARIKTIDAEESDRRLKTVLANVDQNSVVLFTAGNPLQRDRPTEAGETNQYNDDPDSLLDQVNLIRYESSLEPQSLGYWETAKTETMF